MKAVLAVTVALLAAAASGAPTEPRTWMEVNGVVYGAKADARGPIGGGAGYTKTVRGGDYVVKDVDGLRDALAKAKAGQVIFIPGETEIDLTTLIYIEELVLEVPAGVTLAGDRGQGASVGALLCSDALKTPVMIRALGAGVRITGLRVRGPNPKRYLEHHQRSFGPGGPGHSYYYKFPTQIGIMSAHDRLEVDNCDISGFGNSGISLDKGVGHLIHHNFIHHCQYNGLGYGVVLDTASSVIEYNLFDWNRHSIAGTGRADSTYVARNNVELSTSLSHCFDMHGGRDRKDGTEIAGRSIEIYNNTFRSPETPVVIRGIPQEKCDVYHNWFPRQADPARAVHASDRTRVFDNAYGSAARVRK
jgi:Right handed beta helix region